MNALFIYCDNQSHSSDPVELERFMFTLGTVLSRESHFWIIETKSNPIEVRDALLPWLKDFDRLLVGRMGSELAHGCWGATDIHALSKFFKING